MPMKVTVCFDRVRVIVPCGDGEILVRQLVEKAIIRYKKATGKSSDHWVSVHNLRTINDGGILDPDDQLSDVVDDREQLLADYEEQGGQNYQPHNGDGASQSSAGTASPDIFQAPEPPSTFPPKTFSVFEPSDEHDVVVTSRDLEVGSGLTVRHGSEPTLNILDGEGPSDKREHKGEDDPSDSDDHEVANQMSLPRDGTKTAFSRFSRDSWRQSLGNRPDMYKWLEAQERQQEKQQNIQQMERRDPVGGASNDQGKDSKQESITQGGIVIQLPNDGGPLGIHVVPDYDERGRELGLLVQGVEEGGRVFKDGRLRENDRIVEINGQTLVDVNFSRAQDIFRSAMKNNDIKLKIIKKPAPPPLPKQPPPPVMPKPRNHTPIKPSPLTLPPVKLNESDLPSPTGPEQTSTPIVSVQNSSNSSIESPPQKSPEKPSVPVKPSSPTKKTPPAVPTRNPNTTLSNTQTDRSKLVAPTNTKKIGKKIEITLTKGPVSLGFSITTRDNPAGGDSPIYIKNILPRGAAITDGRLKAGDRLLEVNGEDLSGKTQSDVVSLLRNVTMGSTVKLVISRQEAVDERFQVPRELKSDNVSDKNVLQPPEKTGDDGTLANMRNKEILRLDIPLSDSGSAGLGVSVKGKTISTDKGTKDLGIFIKSVINGGAASKDGRLLVNDQLVEVNNETLTGLSNTDAMETLRKAMQFDGPIPGHIHLVVARKIGAPSPSPFTQDSSSDAFIFGANNKMIRESDVKDYSDPPPEPHQTREPPPEPHQTRDWDYMDSGTGRNFLIDRLTNGLRNESYTRATNEEFDNSAMSSDNPNGLRNDSYNFALDGSGNILSPGVSPFKLMQKSRPPAPLSLPQSNVIIENDQQQIKEYPQKMRPHSTIGFLHHSNSSSSEDLDQQPVWLQGGDWTRPDSTSTEELSPMSPLGEFKREGFGRQSMSEKRKGHIDPSKSEVYQRVKTQRQHQKGGYGPGNLVRVGSAESLLSRNSRGHSRKRLPPLPVHGKRITDRPQPPLSNLKRFNSLENLAQVTPSETPDTSKESLDASNDSQEDGSSHQSVKLGRGRGCNLSFRAAVDRSYDPVPSDLSTMDTGEGKRSSNEPVTLETSGGFTVKGQVEEESSEGGSISQGGFTNSGQSSLSSDNMTEDANRKTKKKPTKEKKGVGIFKGLLRRSNKNKKGDETKESEEAEKQAAKEEAYKSAKQEHERIQEQVRQLQEQQAEAGFMRLEQKYSNDTQKEDPASMSRAEWIQNLRKEHQRKHKERLGHYPLDAKEEHYEKEIQQEETRVGAHWYPPPQGVYPSHEGAYPYPDQRYGKSAIPDNILHGIPALRSQSTNPVSYDRPHSRPSFQEPSSYHQNFHYHGNIIHPRQHSNEYIPSRPQPIEHFHQRQNSDLSDQFSQDYYARRPPSRSHTPRDFWQESESAPAMVRQSPYPHPNPPSHPPPPQYGDPIFAYRDPIYPAVAGKRSVQSLAHPGSAKV